MHHYMWRKARFHFSVHIFSPPLLEILNKLVHLEISYIRQGLLFVPCTNSTPKARSKNRRINSLAFVLIY